jgi:hypothetical protein
VADKEAAVRKFLGWAATRVPDAAHMNPSSGAQIRMLLFPDHLGYATKAEAAAARKAKAAAARAAGKAVAAAEPPPAKAEGGAAEAKKKAKKDELPPGVHLVKAENPNYEAEKAAGLKCGGGGGSLCVQSARQGQAARRRVGRCAEGRRCGMARRVRRWAARLCGLVSRPC